MLTDVISGQCGGLILPLVPVHKITTAEIVTHALELFSRRGYAGCSMADVAAACGIQKASVYHHFRSKADLLRAVVQHLMAVFDAHVFGYAYASQYSPEERLQTMLDGLAQYGVEREYGCLLVRLGVEGTTDVPELAGLLRQFYETWQQSFAHLFLEAGHMQPNRSALHSLCELQGALVISCMQQRPELFAQASHHVLQRIHVHPVQAGTLGESA